MALESETMLALVALTIALSAYVATVRQRCYERGNRDYGRALMIADVPLVAAAAIFVFSFLANIGRADNSVSTPFAGVALGWFGLGVVVLFGFHVFEWGRSCGVWTPTKRAHQTVPAGWFWGLLGFLVVVMIVIAVVALCRVG